MSVLVLCFLYFVRLFIFVFVFFFFKQTTAYEMRISDWSSDVCSSDLDGAGGFSAGNSIGALQPIRVDRDAFLSDPAATTAAGFTANLPAEDAAGTTHQVDMGIFDDTGVEHRLSVTFRSEERRVGQECCGKGRSRWSPCP